MDHERLEELCAVSADVRAELEGINLVCLTFLSSETPHTEAEYIQFREEAGLVSCERTIRRKGLAAIKASIVEQLEYIHAAQEICND